VNAVDINEPHAVTAARVHATFCLTTWEADPPCPRDAYGIHRCVLAPGHSRRCKCAHEFTASEYKDGGDLPE
jgi:hypothetical protein